MVARPSPSMPSFAPPGAREGQASPVLGRLDELLAFRAPFFEEKMVKERVTRTRDEAARLLDEAKKYFTEASAHAALEVVVRYASFFVRELAKLSSDEQQLDLARALIRRARARRQPRGPRCC